MATTTLPQEKIISYNGTNYILRKALKISDRGRKEFLRIAELAESIRNHGLIEPIVLDSEDLLLCGERRYRACSMLPLLVDPKQTFRQDVQLILSGYIAFVRKDELSDDQKVLVEIEENKHRQDLNWAEENALRAKAHELQQKIHGVGGRGLQGGWTLGKTAEIFNETPAATLTKIKFHNELTAHAKIDPTIQARLANLPESQAIKELASIQKATKVQDQVNAGTISFKQELQNGNCLELIRNIPDNSVDCVITDPPFGIPDIEEKVGTSGSVNYTAILKPDDNLSLDTASNLISSLTPELFRILKPSSHLWMFFAWEVQNAFVTSLKKAGFDVCPVYAIWNKGRSTSPFKGLEPAPCYEPIIFAHKPPRAKRLSEPCTMVFDFPILASGKKIHRFEKPQELLLRLVSLSTFKGDSILDPFAGSGSTLRAAKSLGRNAIGFEKDKEHFLKSQAKLLGF